MNGESTISRRLSFNMIDGTMGETLRQWMPFVPAEMALVLDGSYVLDAKFMQS